MLRLIFVCLRAGREPASAVAASWLPAIAAVLGAIAAILVAMLLLDRWSVGVVKRLPPGLIAFFDIITDYGRSGWFLVPIGLMLMIVAAACTPSLAAMSQRVLAAVAVRLGFLFTAILLPGLIFTIVKRLIGRARPLVGGSLDPFLYAPLGWNVEYSSLPSGHAVNAFAAATALGAPLAEDASPAMDLRGDDRREQSGTHGALSERRARRGNHRGRWHASHQELVCGAQAGLPAGH